MKPLFKSFLPKTVLEIYPFVLILDRQKREIYQDYATVIIYNNGRIKISFDYIGKITYEVKHFRKDVFVQMILKEKMICILLEGDDLLPADFIFAMTARDGAPNDLIEKFFYYICHVFKTFNMKVHTNYDIFKKGFRN